MNIKECVLGLTFALLASFSAYGQTNFPTRDVTFLVPFAAGGPTDVIIRILADRLSTRWGKPVIVNDKPGGGTIVATALLAKAAPDGYTLGVATNSFTINPGINHSLPYDTLKDFAGVGMVVSAPVVLVANPSFAPNTIAEVIAEAKKSSKPLNFTSPGPRGIGHLAGEWLQSLAHVKMTHIPYNGSAPALIDVIAGRVPMMFDLWNSAKPYVLKSQLKVIAVASDERLQDAPQYPTIATTYPGFDCRASIAIIAPSGVPRPLLEKISADIRAVVSSPDFAEKMKPYGVVTKPTTPQQLDKLIRSEINRWGAITKAANIKVD
jgi:tripartite-type tricarboxylate transporter receptor subunit TctC